MNILDYNDEPTSDQKDKTERELTDPETLTTFELYHAVERDMSDPMFYEHLVKRQYFDLTQLMMVAIRQATITEDDKDDKRQIALSFQGHGDRTIASWSSLCVIKGAPKVGKTTVASLLAAALLGNKSNPYNGHLPDSAEILWFDTEQSRTHCYRTGARIGKLVLGEENLHPQVTMLLIREYSSLVKWQFIQNAVNLNRNVKVIVIDNLADLVSSILDEQEASRLLTGLLRLAEMNSLLVVGILHTNKANKNSRGHVGSLAEQRAETVISVEKSGRRVKIEGSLTRNGPFPTVWYERNQEEIEFFFEHESKTENKFKKNFDHTPLEVHKQVLREIFSEEQQLFPRVFKEKLKKEYELKVYKIGLELVKLLQSYYVQKGLIHKVGSKLQMAC